MKWGQYVLGALIIAAIVHFAAIIAVPRVLMNVAMQRFGEDGDNVWHLAERITVASQKIVRSSPDFAYSACVYDLSNGPVVIAAAPWDEYWSLSLYGDNTDNFFVIDDREAHHGAEITLIKRGTPHPDSASTIVESPSTRGIALMRRLAPTASTYSAAAEVAREDVCAAVVQTTN